MPLRAVCQAAGVQLPTLYHHFGSKKGLLDELVAIGFDKLLSDKMAVQLVPDFFTNARNGWYSHVRFGMNNPGFYILMYGKLKPSSIDEIARRPERITTQHCIAAAADGLLCMPPERAAAHIMCNCIGATLRFIGSGEVDEELNRDICEATLAFISGAPPSCTPSPVTDSALQLLRALQSEDVGLADPELTMLKHWLREIS